MEREELIKKIDEILNRIEVIDKERKALLQELTDIIPVKIGDKVKVMKDDVFVRFTYIDRINVRCRGKEEKARLEFDLHKCKKDGSIGQHADNLGLGEYITKIKD